MTAKKKYRRAIVYMRRALRVHDNTALWFAQKEAEEVIPIMCLSPDKRYEKDTPRRRFVTASMWDLEKSLRRLGSSLTVRRGDPTIEIPQAAVDYEADAVFAVRGCDPATAKRDQRIDVALKKAARSWIALDDRVLIPPAKITTGKGEPYRVFTPYYRTWLERQELITPELPGIRSLHTPSIGEGLAHHIEQPSETGGESAALRRWRDFLKSGINSYKRSRDLPAIDGTSILSPHLALGTLSIRKVYWDIQESKKSADPSSRENIDAFLREIVWREFYYQIIASFPHAAHGAFNEAADDIAWSTNRKIFDAWCGGETGYPFVDAGMRQLAKEGWIHNRVRMLVASFLTKDLHINWQWGEKYFMENLVDADVASNNGGWQWVAGTGTDASPWFRVFNPTTQAKKFDPKGDYVRRYIPQLKEIPGMSIHEPWRLSETEQLQAGFLLGRDYPQRIVDHSIQRLEALEMYRAGFSRRDS